MNQSSNRRNKQNQIGKYSTIFTDENNHSFNSGTALSSQSMVDDIPFEFNPKYRTIIVPNINIPEYDPTKIHNILATPVINCLQKNKRNLYCKFLRRENH
ncbi:unnamed protein product [Rotaria magnacalcarata]|uniref:Uncharacterized protein n=2 Tax=Rotaria magnacalcarata TaxID=392030 RepID=A0A816A8F0_9BILA|nr:unnamed protein product [Rotaria magnacalcarata]CAF1658420.1 unnamed protein product [Rotaria magnacalcarata]CAF2119509.1 unnamed protein product [Rotaria magnacalcarata]CAF2135333.1 unnamed protein product [Rotaria magnacalcarata]CAF3792645.1 unnamed protein product [Rotaria magnacalcarata]